MKELLAVSWAMPPMLFPRSIQVSRTLTVLARNGWKVTVVCSDPQSTPSIDYSLEKLYEGNYKTISVSNVPTPEGSPDLLMLQWLKPAVAVIKTLLNGGEQFSAMVTFAQPWVDHLIGLEVRKVAKIPWIAHFSDPWVDGLYYADISKKLLRSWQKMEKDVIHQADAILFTNSQAVNLVMQKYPQEWGKKVHIVPHGYDSNLVKVISPTRIRSSRMRLVYTGDLYGKRTPQSLFEALSRLSQKELLHDQIEVVLVGRTSPDHRQLASELGLKDVVTFRDQVSYTQSLEVAAGADVLLVIDAPSSTPSPFLPSKLVDYLMFKKPILGLTPSEGASADLLRRLGCPVVAADNYIAIAETLFGLLESWRAGTLAVQPEYGEVAQMYDIQRIHRLLDELLRQVIDKHANTL